MKKKEAGGPICIAEFLSESVTVRVVGTSPIILNRMSEKAKRELLLPKGRRSAADRAQTLKHDPLEEFQASPYVSDDPKSPTYLQALSSFFKKGMSGAATDIPGTNKAQIGRLLWVEGERVPLYGVPYMRMDIVRSSDMNRTPDVRTRCCVKEWACEITIHYAVPLLNKTAVLNLLAAAGMYAGAGDWRPGRGGVCGQYRGMTTSADDRKLWDRLVKTGGRKSQMDAMASPIFYDDDTAELFGWFNEEVEKRGRAPVRARAESNGQEVEA